MEPAVVFSLDDRSFSKASALAEACKLPLVEAGEAAVKPSKQRLRFLQGHLAELPGLVFIVELDVLQMAMVEEGGILAIRAEFHGQGMDYRRRKGGGRSELIAKAVGLKAGKSPTVVDATAGLGVDAFVLASLGCRVTLLERVPAVAALLREGLERSRAYAGEKDAELERILGRMRLIQANAVAYLDSLVEADWPEVIYLDPMFPERKKSAAVKKEMQLFHKLIGSDADAERLLDTALTRTRGRVVVKRPRIAPSLAGPAPSYIIEGKRSRYDVYLAASEVQTHEQAIQ
jgi:16S rRNA (guanine1516-N2)-methyltransferase